VDVAIREWKPIGNKCSFSFDRSEGTFGVFYNPFSTALLVALVYHLLNTTNAVDKKNAGHKEWDVKMKKKVEEIMTKEVITAKENDTLLDVATVLKENKIAGVPVLNAQEEVVGVVSEADILKLLENFHWYTSIFTAHDLIHIFGEDLHEIQRDIEKASKTKVKDVMSKNPRTISPYALIDDAAQIMHSTGFNRLPVVDSNGKLVGIVARADIVASLYER